MTSMKTFRSGFVNRKKIKTCQSADGLIAKLFICETELSDFKFERAMEANDNKCRETNNSIK